MASARSTDTVSLVDGRVDLPTRRVQRFNAVSTLTTLEARLLAYLAARPGEVVPRQTLLEEVWDYHPDIATRAVDQAVWRLRLKIERDPREPRHVLTAHGVGYVFEPADVSAPAEAAPADAEPFVGREAELAWLASSFADRVRMIVLVGPGGVGKTRLATELGFRWAERVVTCDLTHAKTLAGIVEAVGRSFDVALGGESPDNVDPILVLERAVADLGPGLVILDNVELDDGCAFTTLAERWTAAAPAARFLVTTRQAIPLRRDPTIVVRRLEGLRRDSAVALFEARARVALRRRLASIERDPTAVGRLVERVDRLPLAIELAAARAATLSLDAIAEGLGGALGLDHEPVDSGRLEGHRSVRGTLSWSWDLLAGHERDALAQLAVFRGGADREAADAVVALEVDTPRISAVLDSLTMAALVKRRDDGEGDARFALLESVADFVEAQPFAAREAASVRHADYFLGAGERAAAALRGPHQAEAMGWLLREQANLLVAATRALATRPTQAARLALVVEPLLARQGPYARHREVLELAATAATASGDARLLAEALLRRAEARRSAGEREAGRGDLARAHALLTALGDRALAARSALLEGRFRRHDGTVEAARAAFDEAVALAGDCGVPLLLADARRERGTLLLERHAFDDARGEYEAALASYRAGGDAAAAAWTLTRLATVTLELGRYDEAERTFRDALAAHDAVGDRRGHAVVLSNLAVLEHEEGRLDRAEMYWHAATGIHRTLGDARFVGFGLAGLGWLSVERGRLDEAMTLLEEALGVFREAGDTFFEAVTWARMGSALRAGGHEERARSAFARARGRLAQDGAWALEALALHEGLGGALARPAGARPGPPAVAGDRAEVSFQRSARRLWSRVAGPAGAAEPSAGPG